MKKLFTIVVAVSMSFFLFAEESARDMYEKGIKAFNAKDYSLAIKCMSAVVKPSTDFHTRTQAQDIINKCQEMLDRDSVRVSVTGLTFKAEGEFKSLNVWATSKWEIDRLPGWVNVVAVSDNYVKLWCSVNNGNLQRAGNISFRCGNAVETVSLFQDKCSESKGRVIFKTVPDNAYVDIHDGWSGYSSSPVILAKGEYAVKISKEGYETCDTVIVMGDMQRETKIVEVNLSPLFGKIRPRVSSDNGMPVKGVDVKIGMRHIDISDLANSYSFDDKKPIEYYSLYSDGMIPLNPGTYEVEILAEGYASEKISIDVPKGEVVDLDVKLNSIMGQLLVRDIGCAQGAQVVIREICFKGNVGETLAVPVGKHHVEIHKDGYMLDEGSFDLVVEKGKLTVADAKMTRMVDMLVSTEVGGETLFVDGERIHSRKSENRISLAEGEKYNIEVKKDGYWHFIKDIEVTAKDTLFDFRKLSLEEVHPMSLKTDEGGMTIRLKRLRGDYDEDYANGMVTDYTKAPEILNVPYGKYRIELFGKKDGSLKKNERSLITYRGTMDFKENNTRKSIQTWSTSGLAALKFFNLEYSLYPSALKVPTEYMPTPLRLNFMDFTLFKGLSTSLAEGTMVYTKHMAMPSDLPEDHYTTITPATSLIFTNYDFRVGGGLFPGAEVCAFLSYSYDFEYDKVGEFVVSKLNKKRTKPLTYEGLLDHYGGHEFFGGLELSTRMRYFNLYVRAGIQYLKGYRGYAYGYNVDSSSPSWVSKYTHIPVDQTSFIVTVGVNLGGKHSKGQNVLMLF